MKSKYQNIAAGENYFQREGMGNFVFEGNYRLLVYKGTWQTYNST
jgi:hypothetical protein